MRRLGPIPAFAFVLLFALLALANTGCSTAGRPAIPEDPAAALDLGRSLLDADRPDDAYHVIGSIDEDYLLGSELEYYDLLWASALFRTGSAWSGFRVIRDFVEVHRFSDYGPEVEQLHYEIGAWLLQSDGGFLFFTSDHDDGEIVLQEFVERYPSSPFAADALRLLGESLIEEGQWLPARRRFVQLVQDHPNSEWLPLARFRIAMTTFQDVLGPAYDLDAMRRARNELADYLATDPERPEFRAAATEALATVTDWIAVRHQLDAAFYRTVGNPIGERFHLELLVAEFPERDGIAAAEARIRAIDGEITGGGNFGGWGTR